MDENKIIPYIEPIFRFCCKRLHSRFDAEDLSSEIICHILEGMKKYKIESFDAWVWRIASNRYARFIEMKNKDTVILDGNAAVLDSVGRDYCLIEEENTEQEYQTVFRYLHTLSSAYRDIFIDHYIGEMSVRDLAVKYSLPETTIKWRLNTGRTKIRNRIGENKMNQVYKRINWNTGCCSGSCNPDQYLHTQAARAICQAAYEKPLTVEEISMHTGIPAMYIEDELPRLEYGDAVCRTGNKYAANFIVFRLQDREETERVSGLLVKRTVDYMEKLLTESEHAVRNMDFYGHDFGMDRIGYFLVPYLLRKKITELKDQRLHLENGPFPPRKDGGYGWFLVEETVDESEKTAEYNNGCNVAGDDSGSRSQILSHIYYYWIAKYFDFDIYHGRGTRWLCTNGIVHNSKNGMVKKELLSEEDAAMLIRNNLLKKHDDEYQLNFACFTEEQFAGFVSAFEMNNDDLDNMLTEWIAAVHKNFQTFVPKRLNDQINQWVSFYLFQMVGYVIEELIHRGVLKTPDTEKPLTDGVFYVEGRYINL